MTDNGVVLAARRYLVTQTSVTNLLGASEAYPIWIFQWDPHEMIEGTSSEALVLATEGAWSSPNDYNTAQFPRLVVQVFSDPSRDAERNVIADDARDKSWTVFRAVDKLLHHPGGLSAQWTTGVWVTGSARLGEPEWTPQPDGDGLVLLTVSYGLSVVM